MLVKRMLVSFAFLTAPLLLSACQFSPAADPQALERDFILVLPIYNDAGLSQVVTTLEPYLQVNDRFMIISGNSSGHIDTAWINKVARKLRDVYPDAHLYAATSGLTNVTKAAQKVTPLVEAIVYIYEPNFPNQPEFSWDFETTLSRFSEARQRAAAGGFRVIGKPTGRPLLQSSLQDYAWDYGELAKTVDELFIQTQTYCKDSVAAFAQAIDEVLEQYEENDKTLPWLPQVTIDPYAPNGTSVKQAQACLSRAQERGITGTVLWWSPPFAGRVVSFIKALNAPELHEAPYTPQP